MGIIIEDGFMSIGVGASYERFTPKVEAKPVEPTRQTFETIKELVDKCKFLTWDIVVDRDKVDGNRPYIQIQFDEQDRITGNVERQFCRKWYLSYHMTDSEVIRTAHKAVRTAMEHEVDEAFEYDGARIFNPHMDLKLLAKAAKKVDIR